VVALARRTLLYEWRRFLPATVAIAFASLLLLLQASLVLGIFGSASVYVTGSSADVWMGYPDTQSVDQGRQIDPDAATLLEMEPQVTRVEPFLWFDGDWRGFGGTGAVSVFVSGIDTRPDGLMFSQVLSRYGSSVSARGCARWAASTSWLRWKPRAGSMRTRCILIGRHTSLRDCKTRPRRARSRRG